MFLLATYSISGVTIPFRAKYIWVIPEPSFALRAVLAPETDENAEGTVSLSVKFQLSRIGGSPFSGSMIIDGSEYGPLVS